MAWYSNWTARAVDSNEWMGSGITGTADGRIAFLPVLSPVTRHLFTPYKNGSISYVWDWHASIDSGVELTHDLLTSGNHDYGWDGQYMYLVCNDGGSNVYLIRFDPESGTETILETVAFGATLGGAVYDAWNHSIWYFYTNGTTGYLREWDIAGGTGAAKHNDSATTLKGMAATSSYIYLGVAGTIWKWDKAGASNSTIATLRDHVGAQGWSRISTHISKVDDYSNYWEIPNLGLKDVVILYDGSGAPYKVFIFLRDASDDLRFQAWELAADYSTTKKVDDLLVSQSVNNQLLSPYSDYPLISMGHGVFTRDVDACNLGMRWIGSYQSVNYPHLAVSLTETPEIL